MAAAVPGACRGRAALLLLLLGCWGAALAGGLQVRAGGAAAGPERGRAAAPPPLLGRERARGLPRSCPEALAARRTGPVASTGTDTEPRSPALPPPGRSRPDPARRCPWAEPRAPCARSAGAGACAVC